MYHIFISSKTAQSFIDIVDFNIDNIQHIDIVFLKHASIDPLCKIKL